MLKLMWIDGKPMWIPVTEQEDAERVAMLETEEEAEQRKMRECRKMRELNEWLKYA